MILGNTELYNRSKSVKSSSNLKSFNEDSSLFIEALDLLRESDRTINKCLYDSYKSNIMNESKTIIEESAIKDILLNIISIFIDTIKKLFEKFKGVVYKLFNADKGIEKSSDRIRNMKGEFIVTFPRYRYTCLEDDVPTINFKTRFGAEYDALEEKLNTIKNLKTKAERISRLQSIEASVFGDYDQITYDRIRGDILKLKNPVGEDQFAETLFKMFRDGGDQSSTKINNTEINEILTRFNRSKQIVKSVELLKNDIIASADSIKKKINKLSLKGFNTYYAQQNDAYDKDEEVIFNSILRAKSSQINNVCNIYVIAFSAKLDAIRESIVQDRKILNVAITYINRFDYEG